MARRCFLAAAESHLFVPKLSGPRIEVGLLADKYQVDELQKAVSWRLKRPQMATHRYGMITVS